MDVSETIAKEIKSVYFVRGEFDNDEETEDCILGVCGSEESAEKQVNSANEILQEMNQFVKKQEIFVKQYNKKHPNPQPDPIIGKISAKEKEILKNTVAKECKEWDDALMTAINEFRLENYPKGNKEWLKIIEEFTGCWEGSFYWEKVEWLG
jgi:hypothetical protein